MSDKKTVITYANFCSNGNYFTIATETGFKIYKTSSIETFVERNLEERIKLVEIYENSNIVAFTGSNSNGKYHDNNVYIWDDNKQKVISFLRFCNIVQSFKFKNDTLIISTDKKIYIFQFPSLKLLEIIETPKNSFGLFSLCKNSKLTTLAYPDDEVIGNVVVRNFVENTKKIIKAQKSEINCLSLSNTGILLATSSVNGTVVKLFNTVNCEFLNEFRRGSDCANIFNITFSKFTDLLAVTSNKETIHIFSLSSEVKKLKESSFLAVE